MRPGRLSLAALLATAMPLAIGGQSVVVDEGTFAVTIAGQSAGSESFTIRRAGIGSDAVVVANAVVRIDTAEGVTELRSLLETLLPDGAASKYQLKMTGAEVSEVTLALAGRRFVSLIRTQRGEEEREFLARPETRIVEEGVAHQYYFLGSVREGSAAPVLEPRTRRQIRLVASAWVDQVLDLGATQVPAWRVVFTAGEEERIVWFDRQGRVLRLEIPSRSFVAERTDLVG
jgi:hypothetical protein